LAHKSGVLSGLSFDPFLRWSWPPSFTAILGYRGVNGAYVGTKGSSNYAIKRGDLYVAMHFKLVKLDLYQNMQILKRLLRLLHRIQSLNGF
jgi:hypothetical protein